MHWHIDLACLIIILNTRTDTQIDREKEGEREGRREPVGCTCVNAAHPHLPLPSPPSPLQFFIHRVFSYRGAILFRWLADVYDRDVPSNTATEDR